MKLVISTLFFYKQDLSLAFLESILPTLVHFLDNNALDTITFIATNNAPVDTKFDTKVLDIGSKFSSQKNLTFIYSQNEYNKGFGDSHNSIFPMHSSDYFIILNNDLTFECTDWIQRIVTPFKDNSIGIVGVKSSPRILSNDGNGHWGSKDDIESSDYAEGSILAVRSNLVSSLGLFSPDIKWAYFEDSDLSLRYRQAGFKLSFVDIPHIHERSSSAKTIPEYRLSSIQTVNQIKFLKKWGRYLKRRRFDNKIFLDLYSAGWGDFIATLPTIMALLNDHPLATIDIQTNQKNFSQLLDIPRLNILPTFQSKDAVNKNLRTYDRTFSLADVDYTSPLLLGQQIAHDAGVSYDIEPARKYYLQKFSSRPIEEIHPNLKQPKKICIIHAESKRHEWQGRAINPEVYIPSVKTLREKGFYTVLIGADTPIDGHSQLANACDLSLCGLLKQIEMFELLSRSHLYLGIDSGPLHIAQLLGVPSFVIFGATLPSSKLLNLKNSFGYVNSNLDCLGCYHEQMSSSYNFCIRRDEACVRDIDPEDVKTSLMQFIDNGPSIINEAINAERRILSHRQMQNEKRNISRWDTLANIGLKALLTAIPRKFKSAIARRIKSRLTMRVNSNRKEKII